MAHPSTPDIGRIEAGIPLSQLYQCSCCPEERDLFVYRGKAILCAVCDLNEDPDSRFPSAPHPPRVSD